MCAHRAFQVVDHELHHKVPGFVEGGQYEATGTHTEDSDVAVENFLKAQRNVEALR